MGNNKAILERAFKMDLGCWSDQSDDFLETKFPNLKGFVIFLLEITTHSAMIERQFSLNSCQPENLCSESNEPQHSY
jgi:hypothetical protein